MRVTRLELTDIRNHRSTVVEPAPGLTLITGQNGHGKTNLVEALAWCASLSSFRGASTEAVVRVGAERGILRAEVVDGTRTSLVELELRPGGRSRAQLNRQPLRRASDLLGVLRVTVFGPDDLVVVKGGPGERRRFLDDLAVALTPRFDETRRELDRILRQRSALLKQAGPRPDESALLTLDVWDARLAETGERVARRRRELVEALGPLLSEATSAVTTDPAEVALRHEPDWWDVGLAAALAEARSDELRRGVSLVGPHRDELVITLDGLPARTHASQGEQRTLALALRLAGHRLVTERTGTPPVVLLDDVLSELDPDRARALLAHLPEAQVLLTSASPLPEGIEPDDVWEVVEGTVRQARSGGRMDGP